MPDPALGVVTRVTWTAPDGAVTELTDHSAGYLVTPGVRGIDMPPVQLYETDSPFLPGSTVQGTRARTREVMLPVAIVGTGRADALAKRRRLARDLDPAQGPGVLTLTEPDGTARSITAHYSGGMEGSEGADEAGVYWIRYGLTFRCPDPYWHGQPVRLQWDAGGPNAITFPITLPIRVNDSQLLGNLVVDNPGDSDAYPVWTITGPCFWATFRHHGTGETFTLTRALQIGDVAVIDTRPTRQSAVLNGTVNLWPNLAPGAVLWKLRRGPNPIGLLVAGARHGSRVALEFVPRHDTA